MSIKPPDNADIAKDLRHHRDRSQTGAPFVTVPHQLMEDAIAALDDSERIPDRDFDLTDWAHSLEDVLKTMAEDPAKYGVAAARRAFEALEESEVEVDEQKLLDAERDAMTDDQRSYLAARLRQAADFMELPPTSPAQAPAQAQKSP